MSSERSANLRPSSHLRLSSTRTLYLRFVAAETVIHRRQLQVTTVEARLREVGCEPSSRDHIVAPSRPVPPAQFEAAMQDKRDRSTEMVRKAIVKLKRTTCRSRSPGKKEIARATKDRDIDPSGRGVSTSVFRSNQDCLDLYLDACLAKHAESRKRVNAPSWAVRMTHGDLIALVQDAERIRDQLTRDLMAANEIYIGSEVLRIRRRNVGERAKNLLQDL